jgi:serine/threonine protein kinase
LQAVIASGTLTLSKALENGRQITTGLAAAHDGDITHPDIKPANLFLTNEGQVKILDFGLAKLARPEDRFQSARDLLFALEELSTGQVPTRRPRTIPRRGIFLGGGLVLAAVVLVYLLNPAPLLGSGQG